MHKTGPWNKKRLGTAGVFAKVLHYDIVVSEFEHQSLYYAYFQTISIEKYINFLFTPAICYFSFTRMALVLNHPCFKEHQIIFFPSFFLSFRLSMVYFSFYLMVYFSFYLILLLLYVTRMALVLNHPYFKEHQIIFFPSFFLSFSLSMVYFSFYLMVYFSFYLILLLLYVTRMALVLNHPCFKEHQIIFFPSYFLSFSLSMVYFSFYLMVYFSFYLILLLLYVTRMALVLNHPCFKEHQIIFFPSFFLSFSLSMVYFSFYQFYYFPFSFFLSFFLSFKR